MSNGQDISNGQVISGAVHKVRHANFGHFYPSPPCHTFSRISNPTIFSRPSTKIPDKSHLYKFSLNCSRGLLAGGFVRGSFVWKVSSGVVFVRSRSVRIHLLHQKVKHHFKFHVSYV